MPKALKAHPGERLDLVDYVQGANTYTQDSQKFVLEREWLDRRSRVLDGFRIRVEDQATYPGLITVFNGNALDRAGQLTNNEDLENDSRSVTLLGATTNFYVEIEFTAVESDTDARYFWDPTVPNVPPEPDGSEFPLNVATRLTPDWRIVSPVSTTGFQQTTNPNSVRIPVGVFRTDMGNAIATGGTNPGLVLVQAASVLEADTAIGAAQIRVIDARIFPVPPFNITVDVGGANPEARTVTVVDRANGILNLGVATAFAHSAGSIIAVTSTTADLVQQRTDPSNPTLSPSLAIPGHPDPAQRLWQADEVRGSALIQSKETSGSRDDLNVRSLKDEIDYLSAQIREMKFGHPRPEVKSAAPPFAFNTRPRYFDRAGSITGARSNTVSIGNGTTSFGDFNGTNENVFIAALAAVTGGFGGTIYVKEGTYVFTNSVNIGVPVIFVGENFNTTNIQNNAGANPAFVVSSFPASFENLSFNSGLGAAIDIAAGVTVDFSRCAINAGLTISGAATAATIIANKSSFAPAAPVSIVSSTGGAILSLSSFTDCDLLPQTTVFSCPISDLVVDNCYVSGPSLLAPSGATDAVANLYVQNCNIQIVTGGGVLLFSSGTQSFSNINFTNNYINVLSLSAGNSIFYPTSTTTVFGFYVRENTIFIAATTSAVATPSYVLTTTANGNLSDVRFENNNVEGPTGGYVICYNSDTVSTLTPARFCGNTVTKCAEMVRIGSTAGQMTSGDYIIQNNVHNNSANDATVYGVRLFTNPSPRSVEISGNLFANYTSASVGDRFGVDCTWEVVTGVDILVANNSFFNFNAFSSEAYGVYFGGIATSPTSGSIRVLGNKITSIFANGGVRAAGIYVSPSTVGNITAQFQVSNNLISNIGNSGTGVATNAYGIRANGVNYLTIENNHITKTITTVAAGLAASIYLTSCGRTVSVGSGVVVNGNLCSLSEGGTIYPSSGYLIYLTGTCGNTVISNNNCTQYGSLSTTADGHIAVISDTTSGISIIDNVINTSTVAGSFGIFFKYAAAATTSTQKATLIANNSVFINNSVPSTGIYAELGGNAIGFVVDGNTIVEGQLLGSHTGIYVQGNRDPASVFLSRSIVIRNNTLLGVKSGVLVTGRVGIALWDCGRSTVSSNHVDWMESGIAEGTSILLGSILLWADHGYSCVGNFVNPNGNLAGGITNSEIYISSTWLLSGLLDSNIVGTSFVQGTITPAVVPATWTYGDNKIL